MPRRSFGGPIFDDLLYRMFLLYLVIIIYCTITIVIIADVSMVALLAVNLY